MGGAERSARVGGNEDLFCEGDINTRFMIMKPWPKPQHKSERISMIRAGGVIAKKAGDQIALAIVVKPDKARSIIPRSATTARGVAIPGDNCGLDKPVYRLAGLPDPGSIAQEAFQCFIPETPNRAAEGGEVIREA